MARLANDPLRYSIIRSGVTSGRRATEITRTLLTRLVPVGLFHSYPTTINMSGPTPLSEGKSSNETYKSVTLTSADSMIRYRLIHPDKETRPFAKRLHRYAAASSLASSSTSESDAEDALAHERDMIRLETLKWKLSVERMLGSARNLERQRENYVKRAEQTGESSRSRGD
jgi:hypothetical protein